jgi:hypothetical protein
MQPKTWDVPHGEIGSTEYGSWLAIRQRCFNQRCKAYKYYGGRGITMCPQCVDSFRTFYDHMGPKPSPQHSIDRYPNMNGHYEPGNVRWATPKEQGSNKRTRGQRSYYGRPPGSPRLIHPRFIRWCSSSQNVS